MAQRWAHRLSGALLSALPPSLSPSGAESLLRLRAASSLLSLAAAPRMAPAGAGAAAAAWAAQALLLRRALSSLVHQEAAPAPAELTGEAQACVDYLTRLPGLADRGAVLRLLDQVLHSRFAPGGAMYRSEAPAPLRLGDLRPRMEALAGLPGVDLRRALSASPWLLVHGSPSRMAANAQRLRERLGLGGEQLGRLVNGNAYALTQDWEEGLLPRLDYLEVELGLRGTALRKVLLASPRTLAMGVPRLRATIGRLEEVGLEPAEVRAMVTKFPRLASFSPLPGGKLDRALSALRDQGLTEPELRRALRSFPALLGMGVESNLAPTLRLLREGLGLSERAIRKVLVHAPDVVARSEERLRRNVDSWRSLGMANSTIARMADNQPAVLRMDVASPTYAPKLRLLAHMQRNDAAAVADALATNPSYLTYGFDRIALRGAFLHANGRPLTSLTSWLSAPEARFATVFGGSTPEAFRAHAHTFRSGGELDKWRAFCGATPAAPVR